MARRRSVGPARPPDGGAHRVPHARPLARAGSVNFLDLVAARDRGGGLRRVPARLPPPGPVVGRARASVSSIAVAFVDDVADALAGSPPRTAPALPRSRFVFVVGDDRAGRRAASRSGALGARLARNAGRVRQGDRVARCASSVAPACSCWCGCSSPRSRARPGWPARAVRDSRSHACDRPRGARASDRAGDARPPRRRPDVPRGVRHAHVARRRRAADGGIPARRRLASRVGRARSRASPATASRREPGSSPRTTWSSRTRTWSRARAAPASTRPTAAASTPASSPSIPTATSRCCACPTSACPRSRDGDGRVDDRGALFGHPGGGPSPRVADAHRRADRGPAAPTSTAPHRPSATCSCSRPSPRPATPARRWSTSTGRVLGVLFAFDISRETTAYALDRRRARPPCSIPCSPARPPTPKDTGPCLAD